MCPVEIYIGDLPFTVLGPDYDMKAIGPKNDPQHPDVVLTWTGDEKTESGTGGKLFVSSMSQHTKPMELTLEQPNDAAKFEVPMRGTNVLFPQAFSPTEITAIRK